MYQVIDSNGDGLVSRAEFEIYGAAQSNSTRPGASTTSSGNSGTGANGNGIGSTTNFPLLDANSDGYLSQEEFARSAYYENSETAAVDTIRERGMNKDSVTSSTTAATTSAIGEGGPHLFQAADTNADGYINLQEFQRYHSALKTGVEANSSTVPSFETSFRQLDSDSDGRLNLVEFARADAKGNLQTTVRTPGSGN